MTIREEIKELWHVQGFRLLYRVPWAICVVIILFPFYFIMALVERFKKGKR